TLLTDGKARNLPGPWSSSGDQIAYMSTRRTGKDTELWVMNPSDPKSDHLLTQLAGGGWQPLDWSPDDKKILLAEELSINESYLWLVDAATGEKLELTPRNMTEKVSYGEGRFSKDGKGIYVTTDKDSEFHRLAYIDLATKQPQYLTTNIPWDVESFDVTQDGKMIAFMTDEEGVSVLHVMDTSMKKEIPLPKLPAGVMGSLRWHKNGHELGFSLIYPNVRGSTGYGKTFSLLDNGFKREDTYKDVNALFDWIATQPGLDSERIAVTGGSYGGHMTLAVSTFYSDRIRCSVDIVGM